VSVNQKSITNPKANTYPPSIEGDTQFVASYGMVIIRDLIFTATPGNTYSIAFSTDGVDLTKKSNQ